MSQIILKPFLTRYLTSSFPSLVQDVAQKTNELAGDGTTTATVLARAIYSNATTLLLDDVLSAVDHHSARHLYIHALKGSLMHGRRCILVTHATDLVLRGCDYVVELDGGKVVRAGAPARSHGLFEHVDDAAERRPRTGAKPCPRYGLLFHETGWREEVLKPQRVMTKDSRAH